VIFTEIAKDWCKGDYLKFKDEGKVSPGAKTNRWSVWSRHDSSVLGEVRWYVCWRQYVYIPLANKLYDKKCLREVAAFCEQVTAFHKEKGSVIVGRLPKA
jgi:hypothetical protein